MQSKAIPNGRITASSVHGQYVPHLGRLKGRNCWYAKGGDHQSYFQVMLVALLTCWKFANLGLNKIWPIPFGL